MIYFSNTDLVSPVALGTNSGKWSTKAQKKHCKVIAINFWNVIFQPLTLDMVVTKKGV